MYVPSVFERLRWKFDELKPGWRRVVIAGLAATALLFVGGLVLSVYLWQLSRQFPARPFAQPSRLYGAVPRLTPGTALSPDEMVADLEVAGYREANVAPAGALRPGTYQRTGDKGEQVAVHLRHFAAPNGPAGGTQVEAAFDGARLASLRVAGRPAESVDLEPPLLATFYDDDLEERRPVALDDLPDPVVKAVLAAEDDGFFTHPGVSPTGIARATWSNLRGGRLQGGSTITQQLVKNLYLSSRRTLTRKAGEAMIAVMVEMRHSKRAILEAYLNEIYFGRSGSTSLVGLGAAARAYFGKDAAELDLAEAATLAGMIRSPGKDSPLAHPGRSLQRRNWVLQRMAGLGWISPAELRRAESRPLATDPEPVEARRIAPYFAEAARAEAEERFGAGDLDGQGYVLFSTLRWRDQRQAEDAVARGLAGLEKGWEKGRRGKGRLQAALVSVDPREGGILSWVGGRDYDRSQFDRVAQARRQAGSAFKPVIYAAAFANGVASPGTLFEDSPIAVRTGTASWEPKNYDQAFHGWVTARTALSRSFNIPTVRVAFQVGLNRVIQQAEELGLSDDLEPHPSLALGAFETNPLELAEVYSAFATGGMQPSLHGLVAVLDAEGKPLADERLPAPRRVLPSQAAYLVTSVLQGVVDPGTGAGEHALGQGSHLAGKTGTTNDRRDSWFAGYSPDRVTVVWVGYDDNSATHLSGARAALPIWSRFTSAVRPAGGYPEFAVPTGMVAATVDPTTGQLATPYCPHRASEIFTEWEMPTEPCAEHAPGVVLASLEASSPGDPEIDPETGERIAPTTRAELRASLDEEGLRSLDAGGSGTLVIHHAGALPAPGSYGVEDPSKADRPERPDRKQP